MKIFSENRRPFDSSPDILVLGVVQNEALILTDPRFSKNFVIFFWVCSTEALFGFPEIFGSVNPDTSGCSIRLNGTIFVSPSGYPYSCIIFAGNIFFLRPRKNNTFLQDNFGRGRTCDQMPSRIWFSAKVCFKRDAPH